MIWNVKIAGRKYRIYLTKQQQIVQVHEVLSFINHDEGEIYFSSKVRQIFIDSIRHARKHAPKPRRRLGAGL